MFEYAMHFLKSQQWFYIKPLWSCKTIQTMLFVEVAPLSTANGEVPWLVMQSFKNMSELTGWGTLLTCGCLVLQEKKNLHFFPIWVQQNLLQEANHETGIPAQACPYMHHVLQSLRRLSLPVIHYDSCLLRFSKTFELVKSYNRSAESAKKLFFYSGYIASVLILFYCRMYRICSAEYKDKFKLFQCVKLLINSNISAYIKNTQCIICVISFSTTRRY